MSKKNISIIIVSIVIIFILAVILIVVKKSPSQNVSEEARQNTQQRNDAAPFAKGDKGGFLEEQSVEVAVKETDMKVLEEESIKSFAKIFFERYGSFSSDSNYENFNSLKPLMTDNANKEMEKHVKTVKEKNKSGFYGVTTKVLSVKVDEMMDLSAKVNVSYQKQEKVGEKEPAISYGTAEMEMVKEGDVWMAERILE